MSEEYRNIFENWITANGDYPHLKHKSFGGNYLYDEVAMKWDGFKLGINTMRQEVERLRALTEWKDISTAPKDKDILILSFDVVYHVKWNNEMFGGAWQKMEDTDIFINPHMVESWSNLPNAPQIEGK